MSGEQRRLAAVMFTDIVGYSSLTQKNERLALELLEEHRGIVRPIVARHNGHEIKTIGDAFLIEFPSALEATECAVEVQRSLHDHNQQSSEARRVHIRIGIHLGDVIRQQNDVLGDAVNIASRIEPLAEPDGVCISEQVYDQVRNKIAYPTENLGPRQLKNIEYPIDLHRIIWTKDNVASGQETNRKSRLDSKRIALLPFANISPDPADEYFADGMTEELIDRLAQVKSLKVIARTSVMSYKKKEKKVSEISRELEVGTLVEGSVRKAGNRVRVTVQLISAGTEEHLWSSHYDKDLDDIFAVQSEIAESVVEALKVKLLESEKRNLRKSPTSNPEAYTLYLRGRHHYNKGGRESTEEAIKYFERSVQQDPTFALGYAGLATCHQAMIVTGYTRPAIAYPKAMALARKALELDPDLGEAHAVLGSVLCFYERDFRRAEKEITEAIALNPSYSTAHLWYCIVLHAEGRPNEAHAEVLKALELDPLSPRINAVIGHSLGLQRMHDRAIEQLESVVRTNPRFRFTYGELVLECVGNSTYEKALKAIEDLSRLTNQPLEKKLYTAYVYAAMGKESESRSLLDEVEGRFEEEILSPYVVALTYFKLKDNDAGFKWLERAYSDYDFNLLRLGIDVYLEPARSDPRYAQLFGRIGLDRK